MVAGVLASLAELELELLSRAALYRTLAEKG